MVDPTGLKPAPHGLKDRCSVTRAPGQQNGCGGRSRTFAIRSNNPAPYQLGYATKEIGCGGESRTRIISFTRRALWSQLSYAAIWWTGRDSNPHEKFAGLLCSRLHHQPAGGCGWSRTTNLALMRRLLYPLELHSREVLIGRGVRPTRL